MDGVWPRQCRGRNSPAKLRRQNKCPLTQRKQALPRDVVACPSTDHRLAPGHDQSQGTALYFASLNGHLEVVQLLLKKSADANIPNKSGQTPLHVAQTPEVAGALLDAGCDEYATNKVRITLRRSAHLNVTWRD